VKCVSSMTLLCGAVRQLLHLFSAVLQTIGHGSGVSCSTEPHCGVAYNNFEDIWHRDGGGTRICFAVLCTMYGVGFPLWRCSSVVAKQCDFGCRD